MFVNCYAFVRINNPRACKYCLETILQVVISLVSSQDIVWRLHYLEFYLGMQSPLLRMIKVSSHRSYSYICIYLKSIILRCIHSGGVNFSYFSQYKNTKLIYLIDASFLKNRPKRGRLKVQVLPSKVLEIVGRNSRGTNNVFEYETCVQVPGAKSRMVDRRR